MKDNSRSIIKKNPIGEYNKSNRESLIKSKQLLKLLSRDKFSNFSFSLAVISIFLLLIEGWYIIIPSTLLVLLQIYILYFKRNEEKDNISWALVTMMIFLIYTVQFNIALYYLNVESIVSDFSMIVLLLLIVLHTPILNLIFNKSNSNRIMRVSLYLIAIFLVIKSHTNILSDFYNGTSTPVNTSIVMNAGWILLLFDNFLLLLFKDKYE